jgi:hypothetical protein
MNHTSWLPLEGHCERAYCALCASATDAFPRKHGAKAYGCKYIVLGASKLAPRRARACTLRGTHFQRC